MQYITHVVNSTLLLCIHSIHIMFCIVAGSAGGGVAPELPSSRVVLVYFLGGCSYAEIAALRYLGSLRGMTSHPLFHLLLHNVCMFLLLWLLLGYRFIIATTSIVHGNSFLDSMIERVSVWQLFHWKLFKCDVMHFTGNCEWERKLNIGLWGH